MQVAAPLASSFVAYLLGLTAVVALLRKARKCCIETRYVLTGVFLVAGLLAGIWTLSQFERPAGAVQLASPQPPNEPIGEAQGIYPGRVVWFWDPDATNENCTNSHNGDGFANENDDGWFLDKNNDQAVIDNMLSGVLRNLTGESTDLAAWDVLFKYFNLTKHGYQNTGYTTGEKIFIKINATSTYGKGQPWGNITDDYDIVENNAYGIAETSPHLVLSTLRQLINVCGISQEDISAGDPLRLLYNHCYDKWHDEFPDVQYIAHEEGGGRVGVIPGIAPVVFYSDTGSVLNVTSDHLYTVMEDADYMINIPAMKAHARAGITLFAKNHFGSHTRADASHLHPGLVDPGGGMPARPDMGIYRTQVDLMGHDLIGRNTMLFLLDALWSGSEATDPPTKWTTAPFNDDWTSSLFASQDPVAIESVAMDFLRTEYDGQGGKVNYPNMEGVDDYLHQAADSTLWPDGIVYDPENDDSPVPGLGVHEHWNNPEDKEYTRNLGTGDGVELITLQAVNVIPPVVEVGLPRAFMLSQNYPNPFNPRTMITYQVPADPAGGNDLGIDVRINVFDIHGRRVITLVDGKREPGAHTTMWDGRNERGEAVSSGSYLYRIQAGEVSFTRKMLLLK